MKENTNNEKIIMTINQKINEIQELIKTINLKDEKEMVIKDEGENELTKCRCVPKKTHKAKCLGNIDVKKCTCNFGKLCWKKSCKCKECNALCSCKAMKNSCVKTK
jgi:hypothetical protein